MISTRTATPSSAPPDKGGIVSWVHFGDLHMTTRHEQNYRDLLSLIEEVNQVMADSLSFVYLPGDNADQGEAAQYEVVREALDRLTLPWFAIVGDHDVHLKSLNNFQRYMMPEPVYSFEAGEYRFLALNAFASASPKNFDVSEEQLLWLGQMLEAANQKQKRCIVLLHCYPSDLGHSSDALRRLLHKYRVLLVDMGHTHYNEIAHDGCCLYTATRSTGQIEEGPAGFSITNLDHGVVSWRFKPLQEWPLVMITTPAEERLIVDPSSASQVLRGRIPVRVKAWSNRPLVRGHILFNEQKIDLTPVTGSAVWYAEIDTATVPDGKHSLTVTISDASGRESHDQIRLVVSQSGAYEQPARAERDQDNALAAWPERGILGTQLGPNKNGRKW